MQTKSIAIATILAAALSGNAFAAGEFQPASGEGPLFLNSPASSVVTREAVRQQAADAAHAALTPRRHALDQVSWAGRQTGDTTRAEVRTQTREAIARGLRVSSGEMS